MMTTTGVMPPITRRPLYGSKVYVDADEVEGDERFSVVQFKFRELEIIICCNENLKFECKIFKERETMKRLAQKSILMIIAIAIIITGAVMITDNKTTEAKALSPDYTGDPYTIYYFSDYYPSIDVTTMFDLYGNSYGIVYDRQQITYQDFHNLITGNYFTGFSDHCVVIIDIKTFKPDSNDLLSLFYNLKILQGCKTVFVTTYNLSSYNNISFEDYVDVFYTSDLSAINDLGSRALENIGYDTGDYANSVFLIDRQLFNVNNYFGQDMNYICENNGFICNLILTLANYYSVDTTGYDYNEIANELRINYNIKIIVYDSNYILYDILTWSMYIADSIEDLRGELSEDSSNPYHFIAIGISELDSFFYNLLLEEQQINDLPVYLLEADPIIWGDDGVTIISDSEYSNNEEEDLSGMLSDLLN